MNQYDSVMCLLGHREFLRFHRRCRRSLFADPRRSCRTWTSRKNTTNFTLEPTAGTSGDAVFIHHVGESEVERKHALRRISIGSLDEVRYLIRENDFIEHFYLLKMMKST